jgi:hypothetical protein
MSWRKWHTAVRRCALWRSQHASQRAPTATPQHALHCCGRRKERTSTPPSTTRPPRNKSRSRWHMLGGAPRTDGAPRPGPGSSTTCCQWLDTRKRGTHGVKTDAAGARAPGRQGGRANRAPGKYGGAKRSAGRCQTQGGARWGRAIEWRSTWQKVFFFYTNAAY